MRRRKHTHQKRHKPENRQYPVLVFIIPAVIGSLLVISGWMYLNYQKTILSFSSVPDSVALPPEFSRPVILTIPSQSLRLAVTKTSIVNGVWQIPVGKIAHLSQSGNPGSPGNIILYGHNSPSILGKLRDVAIGDSLFVETANGIVHTYTVHTVETVSPDNVSSVMPTDQETLTVYTCTGFLDSKRLVVKALPLLPDHFK